MNLGEIEFFVKKLRMRHKGLNEKSFVTLLEAGGWENKAIREASLLFHSVKDEKFEEETTSAAVFVEEVVSYQGEKTILTEEILEIFVPEQDTTVTKKEALRKEEIRLLLVISCMLLVIIFLLFSMYAHS